MKEHTLAILRRLGRRPDKDLGQNFLIDPGALQRIMFFAEADQAEHRLEIGPGLGALTRELVPYGELSAVELDETFANYLELTFPDLKLHRGDIRYFDFSEMPAPLTVFGNLPYSCTSEIIFTLLANVDRIERAVFMVQKEVAVRLASSPGVKSYGAISVAVQNRADVRLGPVIEPQSFFPEPKVFSQLVELRILPEPRFEIKDEVFFRRLTQALFSKRRKKLLNALVSSALAKDIDVGPVLEELELDANLRPERLSVQDFARLANSLASKLFNA